MIKKLNKTKTFLPTYLPNFFEHVTLNIYFLPNTKYMISESLWKLKKNTPNNKISDYLTKEIFLEKFWNTGIHGKCCLKEN